MWCCQVQAATKEEPGAAAAGRGKAEGHANGVQQHQRVLPEGAETALLYVRFRAAAEPGLKGNL